MTSDKLHGYAVYGVGRMGRAAVFHLLKDSSTRFVRLFDQNVDTLDSIKCELSQMNMSHKVEIPQFVNNDRFTDLTTNFNLSDVDVCVATCGYSEYESLTKACIEQKVNMVDLGGNTNVVLRQRELHQKALDAGVTIIPDCGLAPGLINILGMHAFNLLSVDGCKDIDLFLRVGGLPRNPGSRTDNPLQYSLTWSADGLINEYMIPSEELKLGELTQVPALTCLENVMIATPWPRVPQEFEAFVTGGGSSNLPRLLKGRARNVSYKTLRYRGHCDSMNVFKRLGFFDQPFRQATTNLFETNMRCEDGNDIVIARAAARGQDEKGKSNVLFEVFCARDDVLDLSAMAQTTGYSAACVAQLIANDYVVTKGVVSGEEAVPGIQFIKKLREAGLDVRGARL